MELWYSISLWYLYYIDEHYVILRLSHRDLLGGNKTSAIRETVLGLGAWCLNSSLDARVMRHCLCTAAVHRLHSIAVLKLVVIPSLVVFYWSHFQVYLQVTTNHDLLRRFLESYHIWRQLHELQLSDRRRWSVYPSFSFQILPLTIVHDTEYSRNTGTREKKKKGIRVWQWAEASQ